MQNFDIDKAIALRKSGMSQKEICSVLNVSYSWCVKVTRNVPNHQPPPACEVGELIVDVYGYEGKYAVSSMGKVWTYKSNKWLKQGFAGQGRYRTVALGHSNETRYVHRLVAQAFLENPENKLTVNHKNGNVDDNRLDNLEWATQQEQVDHAIATGLNNVTGINNAMSKLDESSVMEIRKKYYSGNFSHQSLAEEYDVTRACILDVVRGRTWDFLPFSDEVAKSSRWGDLGERHSNSKLTSVQVTEIRELYKAGGCTTRSLAKIYGVGSGTIYSVISRATWKHQD